MLQLEEQLDVILTYSVLHPTLSRTIAFLRAKGQALRTMYAFDSIRTVILLMISLQIVVFEFDSVVVKYTWYIFHVSYLILR